MAAAAQVYLEGHELRPLPGAVASRLARLCYRDEIAPATLDQLIARGLGPRVFFIGRQRYALHADWDTWLAQLAEKGGAGLSGHRVLQQDAARIRLSPKSAEAALPQARSTPAGPNRFSRDPRYNVTHAATAAVAVATHERPQVDPDPDHEIPF
jgi:hypothetical protein